MSKRKTTTKKSVKKAPSSKIVGFIKYTLVILIASISAISVGYFIGATAIEEPKCEPIKIPKITTKDKKEVISTPALTKKLKNILNRDREKFPVSAVHEYAANIPLPPKGPTLEEKNKNEVIKEPKSDKPKLAIIIDDVSFSWDVKAIKKVGIPLTMSFLPPNKIHPDSAKLARAEKFYMVHLPMEAMKFNTPEPLTLKVSNTRSEIKEHITDIKKLFPEVRFINNHTGSRFTSDESSMKSLISILRNENINFIDSRTTAKTKAPMIMKQFNLPYVGRDVFLDHYPDIKSIKKEIKRAIKIAKKHGSAIAIGHPHKNTLEALSESKEILKEVQLVRIDQL
ncbi:MAG: divergent polysaccharide deacetylase family protein [Helicobacteraceae bacterium]|nr:divergent polysaccharide deacetylase family protein [Helicobacteraceae bacterium]